MSACNGNNSDIVREIIKMLASLDPDAVRQTVNELDTVIPDETHSCIEHAKEKALPSENFEQLAISYIVSLAAKDERYLAFAACFRKADRVLAECLKKGTGDADKIKRCLDQYADSLKKCIDEFEKCKKKQRKLLAHQTPLTGTVR